jgi:hypothetical protein
MPDGSVTPNLRSHVMFDKYLLSRLGVNPEALKEANEQANYFSVFEKNIRKVTRK